MKNKFLPFSLIFVFIIIFVIFYKGMKDKNIYIPEAKINKKIPLFSAELFHSNKIVNSSEIFDSKKFYLLNIWSSWCVPCREEHSLLMILAKDKNIDVIGLNYKDTKINATTFLDNLGNPYENIIFDKDGTKAIEWGAFGVPESFLIYNNKVIKKYIGPLNQKIITEIKKNVK
jgi:cytochrome c biogenesis protein CcmG, thiol:disulfide interchange protein DsbE